MPSQSQYYYMPTFKPVIEEDETLYNDEAQQSSSSQMEQPSHTITVQQQQKPLHLLLTDFKHHGIHVSRNAQVLSADGPASCTASSSNYSTSPLNAQQYQAYGNGGQKTIVPAPSRSANRSRSLLRDLLRKRCRNFPPPPYPKELIPLTPDVLPPSPLNTVANQSNVNPASNPEPPSYTEEYRENAFIKSYTY